MISPIALYPVDMACKVRIFNILRAARSSFQVTFVALCDRQDLATNQEQISRVADQLLLLQPINRANVIWRGLHRVASSAASRLLGFPQELYYSSVLNLSASRLHKVLGQQRFDVVLYEYWFSAGSARSFQEGGATCVLDTHDILWRKRTTRIDAQQRKPSDGLCWADRRYRALEENCWRLFDHIIAINPLEAEYIRGLLREKTGLITAGMGVDLIEWAYNWRPAVPPRVVFYGALSGRENEDAAIRSARRIMPLVWRSMPQIELWLVGANPTQAIRALSLEQRVVVTGTVARPQSILSTASVLLCPLTGRYGFRSRLIEAMAIGVPLVVSEDAVWGMDLQDGRGLAVRSDDASMAAAIVELLSSPTLSMEQSRLARRWVEDHYSFEATYGRIVSYLLSCVQG